MIVEFLMEVKLLDNPFAKPAPVFVDLATAIPIVPALLSLTVGSVDNVITVPSVEIPVVPWILVAILIAIAKSVFA